MAVTSMYTKVLTESDETKRTTKCRQRNMSQYFEVSVVISFVRVVHHPVETFSVFSCEKSRSGSFTSDRICMTGLKSSNRTSGFRLYHSPISNTTSRRLRLDLGLDDDWAGGDMMSASPSTATCNKKDTFHQSLLYLDF